MRKSTAEASGECRAGRESRRLNMASRLDQAMRGERRASKREREIDYQEKGV